jgi:hypothetical protein
MSNGVYKQERINKNRPFKSDPVVIANIFLFIEKENDIVKIKMDQSNEDKYKILKNIDGRQTILILANSWIKFHLSDNTQWRWSDQYDSITTKILLNEFYGFIEYKSNLPVERFLFDHRYFKSDIECDNYVEISPGFKDMSYYAKLNEHGIPGTRHEFNLNIDLKQSDGSWMPITIDPIMKNPPPIIPSYYKAYMAGNEEEI